MGIWQHSPSNGPLVAPPFNEERTTVDCPYCTSPLSRREVAYPRTAEHIGREETVFRSCRTCGWWFVRREETGTVITGTFGGRTYDADWGDRKLAGSATLRDFDVTDLSAPIDELRTYLLARYD